MQQENLNATFLITSTKNSSFGTAFCIEQDEKGTFFVTCEHVVDECGAEHLQIEGYKATTLFLGLEKGIDLAVLYVEKHFEAEPLKPLFSLVTLDTTCTIEGCRPHKSGQYLQRKLDATVTNVSKIHSNTNQSIETYELCIEGEYDITQGYSGSAVMANGEVIAVASDRNRNGKQLFALPISYLKEIWQEIPSHFLEEREVNKTNFIHEVFEALDSRPMLLFSPDSYNHTDYIERMREEAMELFGKAYLLEINCGRYHSLKDADKFFQKLSKKLNFGDEVEDSMDFEDALIERFKKADPHKTFLLIVGFERLHEDVRNAFAETLRNLNEEFGGHFNLVIFGGEKLIQLKYSTGIHSYFNNFEQKMIPPFSFEEWQEKYSYLTRKIYDEIVSITGRYAKLSEVCFKAKVKSQKEAKELLTKSLWSSELFRPYRKEKENLSLLLGKEKLGNFHPYCDDELLYKLYWDNLIVEEKGVFVWRSTFLVELGKSFLDG